MNTASFYRDTWAEINLSAIKENITHMKKHIGENVHLMAVVKANAYGHGDLEVGKAALEAGASCLAVAILDEAISLRKRGITAPILVLGAVPPEYVQAAAEYDVTLTGYSVEWLQEAARHLGSETVPFHLKVDTGMNRLGVKTEEEIQSVLKILSQNPGLVCKGVFTHFATADEKNRDYFLFQFERFKRLIAPLPLKELMVHCANSAAGLRLKKGFFNAVRFGIGMYGLRPSADIQNEIPFQLKPAFTLHSVLSHVKKIRKGESVSYGATYTAEKDQWIGTVPIGYADGWLRKLSGTAVLIDGRRMNIAGRICMDQLMVELDQSYPPGTKVTLIGSQKEETITMDEIAGRLETINYEIPCTISSRVPRMFLENESIMEVRNPLLQENTSK
ncbi:alanine racemase [Bacillus sp. L381]|uniref:alanine racemase n=1 Tax=Bacillus TaxID=1386 RepID=UPI000E21C9F5|nr:MULTISPECIES: alanine racemase [Bacillus]MCR9040653.1 alanine racemase [Bacillus velezensis]QUN10062.1 alanine racemase [Bacillus amyloliquefaciens]QYM83135.1 alanine racemase [Bacillus sp. 7D3]QZY12375.1 alanine racemase [Bacillus amyloliquefaciens]RDY83643.1 alanine racemase [Bacillus amyloliquefaciens]